MADEEQPFVDTELEYDSDQEKEMPGGSSWMADEGNPIAVAEPKSDFSQVLELAKRMKACDIPRESVGKFFGGPSSTSIGPGAGAKDFWLKPGRRGSRVFLSPWRVKIVDMDDGKKAAQFTTSIALQPAAEVRFKDATVSLQFEKDVEVLDLCPRSEVKADQGVHISVTRGGKFSLSVAPPNVPVGANGELETSTTTEYVVFETVASGTGEGGCFLHWSLGASRGSGVKVHNPLSLIVPLDRLSFPVLLSVKAHIEAPFTTLHPRRFKIRDEKLILRSE